MWPPGAAICRDRQSDVAKAACVGPVPDRRGALQYRALRAPTAHLRKFGSGGPIWDLFFIRAQ